MLPAGMLGDRLGRKGLTIGALLVFGAGSLWCAYAGSPASLIAARSVLGLGAAVLIPLAMSAVVVLFEPEERPKAVLVLSLSTMVGLPLGPIVGGALLQSFWWGSVFIINVPVIAAALVAVVAVPALRRGRAGEPGLRRARRRPGGDRAGRADLRRDRGPEPRLDRPGHAGLPGRRARWCWRRSWSGSGG